MKREPLPPRSSPAEANCGPPLAYKSPIEPRPDGPRWAVPIRGPPPMCPPPRPNHFPFQLARNINLVGSRADVEALLSAPFPLWLESRNGNDSEGSKIFQLPTEPSRSHCCRFLNLKFQINESVRPLPGAVGLKIGLAIKSSSGPKDGGWRRRQEVERKRAENSIKRPGLIGLASHSRAASRGPRPDPSEVAGEGWALGRRSLVKSATVGRPI